jgi:hypothetical protein
MVLLLLVWAMLIVVVAVGLRAVWAMMPGAVITAAAAISGAIQLRVSAAAAG